MSAPLRPPSSRSIAVLLLIVAAALAALGTLRVRSQQKLLQLRYELTESTAELREKREENRRLRLELSVLTAPSRIERLAETMGLGPPEPHQLREVREARAGEAEAPQ